LLKAINGDQGEKAHTKTDGPRFPEGADMAGKYTMQLNSAADQLPLMKDVTRN